MNVMNVRPLYGMLMQLGMPLYGCLTPDGYKNTRDAWLNPDAMTRRIGFATALASGRLPLGQPVKESGFMHRNANDMKHENTPAGEPANDVELVRTLGTRFSPQTQSAIDAAPKPLHAALILGSPEFMQR
jgi:uncharacterized protein (DUF1800 family)